MGVVAVYRHCKNQDYDKATHPFINFSFVKLKFFVKSPNS